MALCLVFYIPLLREHKHCSSVPGKLAPHFFVDVCPGACLGLGAVMLFSLAGLSRANTKLCCSFWPISYVSLLCRIFDDEIYH